MSYTATIKLKNVFFLLHVLTKQASPAFILQVATVVHDSQFVKNKAEVKMYF